jgi:conjugative transfer signal peptidase TraF
VKPWRRNWISCVALIVLLALGTSYEVGLRVNLTRSFPLGLWRVTPMADELAIGDVILICPPPSPAIHLALERGYIAPGFCPASTSPLIKAVAALSGDHIEIGNSVSIEGGVLDQYEIAATDTDGRTLAKWSGGVVPPNEVFLLSPRKGSYDSRYFGPIPTAGVIGRIDLLVTFTD